MLPPESVPRPPVTIPAAIAAAAPALEPPVHRDSSQGLRGTGKRANRGLPTSGEPIPSSDVAVLPITTAPPALSRATALPSPAEPHRGSSTRLPPVVGPSAV